MLFPFYTNLYDLFILAFKKERIDLETFYNYSQVDDFAILIANMILYPDNIEKSEKSIIIGDKLNFDIKQGIRVKAMELLSIILSDDYQFHIDFDTITNFLITLINDDELIVNSQYSLTFCFSSLSFTAIFGQKSRLLEICFLLVFVRLF